MSRTNNPKFEVEKIAQPGRGFLLSFTALLDDATLPQGGVSRFS
jgi:hypothetical protein